jgi:uncharacterized membrane protein SirB2
MPRIRDGLLLLLGLALAMRLAAWLVAPAVPVLITLLALVAIYGVLVRR